MNKGDHLKLFSNYEAVKFEQENLILITSSDYLKFFYDIEAKQWHQEKKPNETRITTKNYPSVSKEELVKATEGKLPTCESDFLNLCDISELHVHDMLQLLNTLYPDYMQDTEISYAVFDTLKATPAKCKAYEKICQQLDQATNNNTSNAELLKQIKALSLNLLGRNIFSDEIKIINGKGYELSCFIKPVRILDYDDTNNPNNLAEMESLEISIEYDDAAQFLQPFLEKHFDENLQANKRRVDFRCLPGYLTSKSCNETIEEAKRKYTKGLEEFVSNNFYTFEAVLKMLSDIRDTIRALQQSIETDYTRKLKEKRGMITAKLTGAAIMTQEEIEEYNASRPTVDNTAPELIVNFYERFIYRMEYMMQVGSENGCDLISIMGL